MPRAGGLCAGGAGSRGGGPRTLGYQVSGGKKDLFLRTQESFFPMERRDYTEGQMQYSLLKKEKYNLKSKQSLIQYDRLSPKK